MSTLPTKPACQSMEPQILGLVAQFGVMLLDEPLHEVWMMLEHGMVLPGHDGRDARPGGGGGWVEPRRLARRGISSRA